MKKPRIRKPPVPRNLAAKSLRTELFRPKVERNPKAYKRRQKHEPHLPKVAPDDEDGNGA